MERHGDCSWLQWPVVYNFWAVVAKENFTDKLKLNPSNDPPSKSFDDTLMRWKLNWDPGGVQVDALVLKNSYRCLEIVEMFTLKEIFDLERNVDFLQHRVVGTIIVVYTSNNFEELTVWKGHKWESMLVALKDYIMHKCICMHMWKWVFWLFDVDNPQDYDWSIYNIWGQDIFCTS